MSSRSPTRQTVSPRESARRSAREVAPARTVALPVLAGEADAACCGETGAERAMSDVQRATADLEILAHPVRLQLLDMLVRAEGAVCVCDLEAALPVKQPTVSHHLRLLREADLVQSERHAQWAYYRVNRESLDALRDRIGAELTRLA